MNLRIAIVGVLLLAGCTPSYEIESEPRPARSLPSPTASMVRAEFLTAVQRLNAGSFRFSMNTNSTEGATVTANGTLDPVGKRYETTTVITGDRPQNYTLVIVGNDTYVKQAGERTWVHLDMARVDPASFVYVDTADPSGLTRLISDLEKAQPVRREPTGWSGRFDPRAKGEYLPVGSPIFWAIASSVPFTVTVDAQGLITSIVVKLSPTSGPEITMTTTFTAHGAAVAVKAPPKGSTAEADDLYYR